MRFFTRSKNRLYQERSGLKLRFAQILETTKKHCQTQASGKIGGQIHEYKNPIFQLQMNSYIYIVYVNV